MESFKYNSLTKNAVHLLSDKRLDPKKHERIVLQIVYHKEFEAESKKKNLKSRMVVSDGTVSCQCIVADKVFALFD